MIGTGFNPVFTLKTVHTDKDGHIKSEEIVTFTAEKACELGFVTPAQIEEMKAKAQEEEG
jgi:hypothetical protein